MDASADELRRATAMQRAVYDLYMPGETTLREIDAEIGCTSGSAAKMRLYRMRKKLGIPAPGRLPGKKRRLVLAQQP